MVASLTTATDMVNLALARIGYKKRLGSLWDGSEAAKLALTIYGQTRDQLIREGEWEFAERILIMTLLKTAPDGGYAVTPWSTAYPALPWRFSYEYPEDCLKVRAIRKTPAFVTNYAPAYNIYSIDNDNSFTPPKRVILCNVQDAILTYAGRVTDPTNWDPDFTEALSAALARRLAPSLAGLDAAKMEMQDEQLEEQVAASQRG